jgi:hypothetical protein
VDPVPDTLLLRKSGCAGNRIRDLWICNQEFWPPELWWRYSNLPLHGYQWLCSSLICRHKFTSHMTNFGLIVTIHLSTTFYSIPGPSFFSVFYAEQIFRYSRVLCSCPCCDSARRKFCSPKYLLYGTRALVFLLEVDSNFLPILLLIIPCSGHWFPLLCCKGCMHFPAGLNKHPVMRNILCGERRGYITRLS